MHVLFFHKNNLLKDSMNPSIVQITMHIQLKSKSSNVFVSLTKNNGYPI